MTSQLNIIATREDYLQHDSAIDWATPKVLKQAQAIAQRCSSEFEIAQACFHFVRDHIQHSWDFKTPEVTFKASEVLNHKTGFCYAKSHLLAALLRANGIPCGLCYQRLTLNDNDEPLSLHGLNAVYLEKFGWYRIDARGNKSGINAQFTPPNEALAFALNSPQEWDGLTIHPAPIPPITKVLTENTNNQEVYNNLPDDPSGQWR